MWDDDCEGAFQTLKAALVTAPILTYPTREGHFILSTDASDVGIGAVLEQEQEEGGRVAKKVIAYASKVNNVLVLGIMYYAVLNLVCMTTVNHCVYNMS